MPLRPHSRPTGGARISFASGRRTGLERRGAGGDAGGAGGIANLEYDSPLLDLTTLGAIARTSGSRVFEPADAAAIADAFKTGVSPASWKTARKSGMPRSFTAWSGGPDPGVGPAKNACGWYRSGWVQGQASTRAPGTQGKFRQRLVFEAG